MTAIGIDNLKKRRLLSQISSLLFSPSPHHFKTKNFRIQHQRKKRSHFFTRGAVLSCWDKTQRKRKNFWIYPKQKKKFFFFQTWCAQPRSIWTKSSKGGIGWEDLEGGIEGGSLSPLVFYFWFFSPFFFLFADKEKTPGDDPPQPEEEEPGD